MDSFAQYRLNDYSFIGEYERRMGTEYFRKYRDDVYIHLAKMNPGDRFSVEILVKKENLDLFIKLVCLFILEGNPDYEFTDDYKNVKRNA
ncbi:MAG: hypothetical protein LBL33_10820 [Tannerella sp.]|jgi:hypothetical protein|nr:hypothetical protein [Tannerella sp.]